MWLPIAFKIRHAPVIRRRVQALPIPSQLPLFQLPTCTHTLARVAFPKTGKARSHLSLSTYWEQLPRLLSSFLADSCLYLEFCPNHYFLWKLSTAPQVLDMCSSLWPYHPGRLKRGHSYLVSVFGWLSLVAPEFYSVPVRMNE